MAKFAFLLYFFLFGVLFFLATIVVFCLLHFLHRKTVAFCRLCGKELPSRDKIIPPVPINIMRICPNCQGSAARRLLVAAGIIGLLCVAEAFRLAGSELYPFALAAVCMSAVVFFTIMIAVAFIDWEHLIIPDALSVGGAAAGLAFSGLAPSLHAADEISAFQNAHPLLSIMLENFPPWTKSLAASGAGVAFGLFFSYAIYMIGSIIFRKQIENARRQDKDIDSVIGFGDVKLMGCIGAFLGWKAVMPVFGLASVASALVGSAIKLYTGCSGNANGWRAWRERWKSGDSVLPFGPFIAFAALVIYFFQDRLWELLAN